MLNTELRTASARFHGREATVYLNGGTVTVQMQPSGRCLLSGRFNGVFFSCYEENVLATDNLTNRMYAQNDRYALTSDEVHDLSVVCNMLRSRNRFDVTLAPGPSFQGK